MSNYNFKAIPSVSVDVVKKFSSKMTIVGECHEFKNINSKGYGYFYFDGTTYLAHRVSYTIFKGAIPAGLVIDHLCRNTKCVNPAHLEAVSQFTNVRRSIASTKTECRRGHKLEGSNVVASFANRNQRTCKVCDNAGRQVRHIVKSGVVLTAAEREAKVKASSDYLYSKLGIN